MSGRVLADGAHLGVGADRALETILGGKPLPDEDEQMTDAEFAGWIRSAPDNFEDADYGEASRRLARLYLVLLEDGHAAWDGPEEPGILWRILKRRWPDLAEEAGSMSGFMHGWAFNAARKVLSMPPVRNPALLEIEL